MITDNSNDEPDAPLATAEAAKTIKAIDKTTVHRICSGQVVLTLATAVKELVENSIDAGATSVEVRLKDHGMTLVEVTDNGKGVEEENFEGLTLKHHTSKLQDFGDLVGVKTFGFRGEALSSLCALSNLSVITRHISQPIGTKLVYDHNGRLTSKTPLSRKVGTTVSLQNLFSTLPVRHKEFQRNIKKEFTKMVQVLYSYCLISTGIRINCTNQTENGKKTVVVCTDGHGSIKDNISSVFGAKQVSSLLEFKQEAASSEVLAEYGMPNLEVRKDDCLFTIDGFISSCSHGQGRSTTDRQFYFINRRPCDPAKVMKLVNEVYHYYNRHQSPFLVLNISLKEDDVDINVTPDKRQILVNNEKIMLATIKTSMLRLYENIPSTYNMQNTSLNTSLNRSFDSFESSQSPNRASPKVNSSNGRVSALTLKFGRNVSGSPFSGSSPSSPLSSPMNAGLKRSFSDEASPSNKQPKLETFFKNNPLPSENENDPGDNSEQSGHGTVDNPCSQSDGDNEICKSSDGNLMEDMEVIQNGTDTKPFGYGQSSNFEEGLQSSEEGTILIPDSQTNGDLNAELTTEGSVSVADSSRNENFPEKSSGTSLALPNGKESSSRNSSKESDGDTSVKSVLSKFSRPSLTPSPSCKKAHSATNDFLNSLMAKKSLSSKKLMPKQETSPRQSEIEIIDLNESIGLEEDVKSLPENDDFTESEVTNGSSPDSSSIKKLVVFEEYNPRDSIDNRKSRSVNISLASLRERLAETEKEDKCLQHKFHAKIAPADNKSAEDELRKEISKDMFAQMEILGQFNLGFIIAKLGSDLFIVDQHATDEKYNFETLQQTCIIQNQRLIVPQALELTAVNESILLDNIEIFKKNGFQFKVDEEKPVGRRVSLTNMPFSRGWEFGKDDIEELIFMLSDAPGVMCRPSRVRAMFASRACRKSVMIGTALTTAQMQKLVMHMGEIEQPWNCPHGRPTMRHLVNLDMISDSQSD